MLCEATLCSVLAQAVIWPVTAKIRLHSQTSQCGSCGGKLVIGQVYFRVSRFLLFMFGHSMPHTHLFNYDQHCIILVLTASLNKANELCTPCGLQKEDNNNVPDTRMPRSFPVPRIFCVCGC